MTQKRPLEHAISQAEAYTAVSNGVSMAPSVSPADERPDGSRNDGLRNRRQRDAIDQLKQAGLLDDPALADVLRYAYRQYRVPQAADAGADTITLRLADDTPLTLPIALGSASFDDLFPQRRLCLFNLIVALEWQPSRRYLDQLSGAFERASQFLYDVTDGFFALHRVLIGGPELMSCADIQIMASNRLSPRSWVSGMHVPNKYTPIRIGRGLWTKTNRFAIPWDEPESYRTLVHELAHYALELKDEYLTTQHISRPGQHSQHSHSAHLLVAGDFSVVVPQVSPAVQTIMATLEGTSELVPQYAGGEAERKGNVWRTIRDKQRYPELGFDQLDLERYQPLTGPNRLPLELVVDHLFAASTDAGQELLLTTPSEVLWEHCWAYLLKGGVAADQSFDISSVTHVVAQGTLDARAQASGFRLLGAEQGDTVVLIGRTLTSQPVVLRGQIASVTVDSEQDGTIRAEVDTWHDMTPAQFPLIDVLAAPARRTDEPLSTRVSVQVSQASATTWDLPRVFPLGRSTPLVAAPGATITLPTLDGHVLLSDASGQQLIVATFSQGGNPTSGNPSVGSPITAGSSEGNVMLFFEDKVRRDHGSTKVVTTLIHGDLTPDQASTGLPEGVLPRSYIFSIASNAALPLDCSPTLVMNYDAQAARSGGDLLIYRYETDEEDSRWTPVPTYLPHGASFAAAPLTPETTSQLFNTSAPRIERFRLCWTPHARS